MDNIDFSRFALKNLLAEKNVGVVYEKIPPKREFCDTLTIYRDGKILFARYCFGESAGVVCKMWATTPIGANGEIAWDMDSCYYSRKNEAPKRFFATDNKQSLYFDDLPYEWFKRKDIKTDAENGYTFFKCLGIK